MALVDPSKLIGSYGVTLGMTTPFGFQDAFFYDQMWYTNGTMHAFTYNFIDDVQGHFRFSPQGCSQVGPSIRQQIGLPSVVNPPYSR